MPKVAKRPTKIALRSVVKQAIKCGPIPKLRDWRSLPTAELTRAERNMRFIERYCLVPEGPLVGKPVRLADFQEAFFYAIYDNRVVTKKAILSIARKNSKTATIACIVLVHVVGPEAKQNSRINSGARSRDQAADLSATTDLTALVLTNRNEQELSVAAHFWMPEAMVDVASKRDRAPYDVWVRQGLIRTTPGSVIDYDFVARDIGEICADLDIEKIAFDRWRMDRMKGAMERQAVELPLEPFGQGFASMSPAVDALEADLLAYLVRHGNNPVLAMCAANAVAVQDPAGNRKLDKKKSTGRIDGMVALAMAEGVEAMNGESQPSVYQERGLLVL